MTSASSNSPVYLDCAATAPIDPAVLSEMNRIWMTEPGNAGSRTHVFGLKAKQIVQKARERVARVVAAEPGEIIFTSGATESNNLAILGLASFGEETGRKHIVSTAIEHKAVLEPLKILENRGFEITLIRPDSSGAVDAVEVVSAVRTDTLLVSVMQVNNETGIRQPIEDIARLLENHDTWFHIDAAQGFGKDLDTLRSPRIDLVSVSSHKISGPVGVGALAARRRDFAKPPLAPIMFGGGQERGVRHGTLPVALIAGMGLASELSETEVLNRHNHCLMIRKKLLQALSAQPGLEVKELGDQSLAMPHILNFSVRGIDAEAVMVILKDLVAVSNGSACTSQSFETSHVLGAMGLPDEVISGAVRFSWCHLTPDINWTSVAERIARLS